MQLSIMKKVKSGELSIEDALDQARKDGMQLFKQAEEVTFHPSKRGPEPGSKRPSGLSLTQKENRNAAVPLATLFPHNSR